jgi:hypothetical protein
MYLKEIFLFSSKQRNYLQNLYTTKIITPNSKKLVWHLMFHAAHSHLSLNFNVKTRNKHKTLNFFINKN